MRDINFLKDYKIAHRGIYDNKNISENSIFAFEKAIKKKEMIELDIHLTKDEKIVVFHDDTLDRMTNKKGNVYDYTLEELTTTKLVTGSTIPSLEEVLKLVDGKVPLLIELKIDFKNYKLEKELIKLLDNYNGEFAIQSFRPGTIIYFRIFRPKYIRGLLISKMSNLKYKSFKHLFMCKPDFINVNKNVLKNKKVKDYDGIKIVYNVDKKDMNNYSVKCDNIICNL